MNKTITGVAQWAKLGIPKDNYDEYQGNGNKNYIIDLYVSPENLEKFKADFAAAYDSIKDNPKYQKNGTPQPYPGEPQYLPTRTDKDGKEFIRFTTKAFTPDGEQKTFPLFDSTGKPLEKQVGNGSEITVSYVLSGIRNNAKNAGVCAYMNAIMVNKLVEFGAKGSAESFGFTFDKPSDEYFPEPAGDEEIPI